MASSKRYKSNEPHITFELRPYAEAMRYMKNAKDNLAKAGLKDDRYIDRKYVRTACGVAYNGVLVALNAWLKAKDVEFPKKRPSIDFYTDQLAKLNGKMSDKLDVVYDVLHLLGYYDGLLDATVIKAGFKMANEIIETIKPAQAA